MKKTLSALTVSAFMIIAVTSCKKTQDVMPLTASDASNSVSAINDSAIITYANGGECALLHGLGLPNGYNIDFKTLNFNNYECFDANSWTYSGIQAPQRSLLKFSFSNLNAACTPATLVSAKLFLYQYVNAGNGLPYSIGHVANDAEIRRVKTPWSAATVTWNTQPSTYPGLPGQSRNAVAIPSIVTPFSGIQDIQQLDVTDMVKKMIVAGQNNGFELRFPDGRETQAYKARFYGSLFAPNIADRPVLKLYWQ